MNSRMFKRLLAVVLILCLSAVFAACGDFSLNKKIPSVELLSVNFENYDGYGYLKVITRSPLNDTISYQKIEDFSGKYFPELVFKGDASVDRFNDIINFVPEEYYTGLSNGDTVYVVAKVTNLFAEQGVTIDTVKTELEIDFDERISFTVSGLPSAAGGVPIDITEELKEYVKFSDSNFDGYVEVDFVLPEPLPFSRNVYNIYPMFKKGDYKFYTYGSQSFSYENYEKWYKDRICISTKYGGLPDATATVSLTDVKTIHHRYGSYSGICVKPGTTLVYLITPSYDLKETGMFFSNCLFTVVVPEM